MCAILSIAIDIEQMEFAWLRQIIECTGR